MNVSCWDSKPVRRATPARLGFAEVPALIIQGPGTKICGPCCVAMLLDVTVLQALQLMCSKGGATNTQQLSAALGPYYKVSGRLERTNDLKSVGNSVVRLTLGPRRTHWVLKWGHFIYDPSWGAFHEDTWLSSVTTHVKGHVTSVFTVR